MKKGLLLSVVASTVIFAGGDIAPVQPEVVAPAADCSDFSGHVGIYYNTIDDNLDVDVTDGDLFGKNTSKLDAAASIHVEKEIAYGIGFGATAGGIAQLYNDTFVATDSGNYGGLQELYLTMNYENTAIKLGRFALPGSLSPLVRTGDTDGVLETTYQGVLLANTDLADTTLYAAVLTGLATGGTDFEFKDTNGDNNVRVAVGLRNTSFAGTTITAVGYYAPELLNVSGKDAIGGVLTVGTSIANYGVTGQVAYIDGGLDNQDATIAAALKVSGKYDMFSAWAQLEYTTDGDYAINIFGPESLMADSGLDSTAIKAGLKNISVGAGSLYVSGEYRMSNADNDDATTTIFDIGYDFKYAGVNFNAEYEYTSYDSGVANSKTVDTSEISLSAVYKF